MSVNKLDRFILSYDGNKYQETKKYLKDELSNYKDFDIIAEPFCGIFGFSRAFIECVPDFKGEIWLNDIDDELINIYTLLKTDSTKLLKDAETSINAYESDISYTKDSKKSRFLKLIGRCNSVNLMQKTKGLTKIKNFREKDVAYKNFFERVKLFNMSNNEFLKQIPKNKKTLIYFDPPYLDSNKKQYIIYNNIDPNIYVDNSTIYIEILKYFETTDKECLFVMNKIDVINYIFKKFVFKEYTGSYQSFSSGTKNKKHHIVYKKEQKTEKTVKNKNIVIVDKQ